MLRPGTSRNTSGKERCCRAAISAASMTVTLLPTWSSGVAMRVAVTTTLSGGTARSLSLCARAALVKAMIAALERRKDFNMRSPEGVQEPPRRSGNENQSQMPRDDSTLVAATVHPVILGAPRPKTGRRCEAGFLASGSGPWSAFPIPKDQWQLDEGSPVTVAGAAAALHRVPYTLHLAPAFAPGELQMQLRSVMQMCHPLAPQRAIDRYRGVQLCVRLWPISPRKTNAGRCPHAAADQ